MLIRLRPEQFMKCKSEFSCPGHLLHSGIVGLELSYALNRLPVIHLLRNICAFLLSCIILWHFFILILVIDNLFLMNPDNELCSVVIEFQYKDSSCSYIVLISILVYFEFLGILGGLW